MKGMLSIIKGSLTIHHAIYGYSLWGRDPDSFEMICLGEMDDRAEPREYDKRYGSYEPNSDPSLKRDYEFKIVEVDIPEEYRRAFVHYQD